MPRLIINISDNSDFVQDTLNKIPVESRQDFLLDITGVTPDKMSLSRIYARDFDLNGKIEQQSIGDYVETIGQLSLFTMPDGKNIRSVAMNGLPLFWVTNLAQKHPFRHWGATMFYLKHIIANKVVDPAMFNEVIIIASMPDSLIREAVNGMKFFPGKVINVIGTGSKKNVSIKEHLKLYLRLYRQLLNRRSGKRRLKEAEMPTLAMVSLAAESFRKSPLTKVVSKYLESSASALFLNFPDTLAGRNAGTIEAEMLLSSMPGTGKFISLLRNSISLRRYLQKQLAANGTKNWLAGMALEEMLRVLSRPDLLFYHQWMDQFFSTLPAGTKLFYEDEVYITGRTITHAASKHFNLTTIGYQHGNIGANHTVYCISQTELTNSIPNTKDAMPFPNYFLFWGEHFKKQFLQYNQIDVKRLIPAGNLQYIQLRKQQKNKLQQNGSTVIKILWCTTSFELAKMEYSLFSHLLEKNEDWQLVIRMHPLINISDQLNSILPIALKNRIIWGEPVSVYDQLKEVHLMICSAHSSVFFDAINMEVPVIRVYTPFFMKEYIQENRLLKNISTIVEMDEAVHQLLDPAISKGPTDSFHSYIFNSDTSYWDRMITTIEKC